MGVYRRVFRADMRLVYLLWGVFFIGSDARGGKTFYSFGVVPETHSYCSTFDDAVKNKMFDETHKDFTIFS